MKTKRKDRTCESSVLKKNTTEGGVLCFAFPAFKEQTHQEAHHHNQ
jgi:hypothetical protein